MVATPVSAFLIGINLIVRSWSETHRSSGEYYHTLEGRYTVKFGQLLSLTVTSLSVRLGVKWSFNYCY